MRLQSLWMTRQCCTTELALIGTLKKLKICHVMNASSLYKMWVCCHHAYPWTQPDGGKVFGACIGAFSTQAKNDGSIQLGSPGHGETKDAAACYPSAVGS
ncbi:hypothetical protein VNO77_42767 [Canavalia gladiata]|uniref:Uncharacterized protein n=1 Tax=Canavalia gladiata TaxID=3824 RepID=A0AAN9JV49_CANGL